MIDNEIGQQYLDQFDTLDIAEKPQRRVGVYVLKEFHATVMADVGREYLSIEDGMERDAINEMWGRILARIESLEGFSKLEGAKKMIYTLKQERNDIHHNTDHDPPVRQLNEIRKLAPTWRDWLLKYSRKYYEYEKELDPHGTVVEMAKTTLQEIKAKRPTDFESSRSKAIITETNGLIKHLNRVKEENDEITTELINILKTSLTLLEDMENEMIRREHAITGAVEDHNTQEFFRQR